MFRGIHVSKGDGYCLVHGGLFVDEETGRYYIMFGSAKKPESYEVFPDSISECAEIRDKNGNYIYQGDYLKIKGAGPENQEGLAVTFADGAFWWHNRPLADYLHDSCEIEIVGHNYDRYFDEGFDPSKIKVLGKQNVLEQDIRNAAPKKPTLDDTIKETLERICS